MPDLCYSVYMEGKTMSELERDINLADEMVRFWSAECRFGEVDEISRISFKYYWLSRLEELRLKAMLVRRFDLVS